ncbi:MAG: hypothetical protein IKK82_13920 [Kiritimatiellae bacterium]|nr:hypothetical protein [Kiritimatiellia bacterium]
MFKPCVTAVLAALSFVLQAQVREKVLVVCAHPDDSIAVAGTLFLMKDKFEIHVSMGRDPARGAISGRFLVCFGR